MLPKTGVVIQYATAEYYANTIMRTIFNISKPQIKKVEKMNDKDYGIGGQIYF